MSAKPYTCVKRLIWRGGANKWFGLYFAVSIQFIEASRLLSEVFPGRLLLGGYLVRARQCVVMRYSSEWLHTSSEGLSCPCLVVDIWVRQTKVNWLRNTWQMTHQNGVYKRPWRETNSVPFVVPKMAQLRKDIAMKTANHMIHLVNQQHQPTKQTIHERENYRTIVDKTVRTENMNQLMK